MPILDYSAPELWGPKGGLGDLPDYLLSVRKQRVAEEQARIADARQQAAQAFTESQARQQEERLRRRAQQDDIEFQQRQARQRFADTQAIARALGAGAYGQAQALGAASQYVNPKTNQLEGVGVSQKPLGPAPVAPMAPQEPQAPEFVGPLEDPESARARAMAGGLGFSGTEPPAFHPPTPEETAAGDAAAAEVNRQQAARDKFAADQAAYPQQEADYQQAKGTYDKQAAQYADEQAHPKYQLNFPGQAPVDIDPREQKAAQESEARDTAMKLRQAAATPGQNPDVARSMLLQAGLIETQLSNADKAPITNMAAQTQSQGFKAGEAEKDRANKLDIAKTRAKKIGKGLGAGGKGKLEGLSELIKMKEDGKADSEIAARAAQLGIPAGGKDGWLNNTKEVVRGAGVKFRQTERTASQQVTDQNGKPLGEAKSPQEAQRLSASNKAFAQVQFRLNALINDVRQNGSRIAPWDNAGTQRRNSLMNAANAALRVYNGLGATDASQRMEAEISGSTGTIGHGIIRGADADVLQHLLTEAEQRHKDQLAIGIRSGSAPGGAGGGVTSVTMPDGSVQKFDASGKRVQ